VIENTRLLGIDYGTVRIGLAVSDPDRKIAFPKTTYLRTGWDEDAQFFHKLVQDEEIGRMIVGLPVHLNGQEGKKAAEARAFGRWLQETTGLPVSFWDERFTTVEAEASLWSAGMTHKRRKDRRDRVAAQIMLQSYLEAECPSESIPGPLGD